MHKILEQTSGRIYTLSVQEICFYSTFTYEGARVSTITDMLYFLVPYTFRFWSRIMALRDLGSEAPIGVNDAIVFSDSQFSSG